MTGSAVPVRRFDVAAFIDARDIGTREIVTLVIVATVLFLDGFDTYFLGKILPAIATGLGGTPVDMAPVVTWQQWGMVLGAIVMPPLADRIGRKPVLALCLLGFGGGSLACAYATSFDMLALFRGFSGIFFSAMLPVGLALLSESTPRRRRALFLAIALACYSGGNFASAAMTAWWLADLGWQGFFIAGGVVPIAALVLLLFGPESVAFRVNRDGKDPEIPRALRHMDRAIMLEGDEQFHMGTQAQVEKAGPLAMFGPRFRTQTILLWMICFMALGNIALMANWLPTFMQELAGLPIETFALYMTYGYVCGACGTLVMGWLMDRLNPYKVIACYFVVDAVAIASLGHIAPEMVVLFMTALIVWNFCQTGGQTGINNLGTLGYPPEMRSSGIGWAGAIGRLGGVLFPFLGGLALGAELPLDQIMLAAAAPAVCIAVLITILGRVNGGKISATEIEGEAPVRGH